MFLVPLWAAHLTNTDDATNWDLCPEFQADCKLALWFERRTTKCPFRTQVGLVSRLEKVGLFAQSRFCGVE